MLLNYLAVAVRHLRRSPAYSAINVLGLAIGIAACMLLALFVRGETGYDTGDPNAGRVVRIVEVRTADQQSRRQASTPPALAAALTEDVPQVESTFRLYGLGRTLVEREGNRYFESSMYLADSTIFEVLTLPLIAGDRETALSRPFSLVLSQTLARKYFGDEDPIGQILVLDSGNEYTVTGVTADRTDKSHVDLSMIGSFQTLYRFEDAERLSNWIWQQFYTYALLRRHEDVDALRAALPGIVERRAAEITAQWGFQHSFEVQPMKDIYLRSGNLFFDSGARGSAATVWSMAAIAAFILLIACFNFMNLSTARSMKRAREVGVRKVMGAQRSQLVRQFLAESGLLALVSFVIAAVIVAVSLPWFSDLTGRTFAFDPPLVWLFSLAGLAVIAVVGLGAGLYPALYLSSFQPASVLRSLADRRSGLGGVRRALVIIQFTLGVALLGGTTVIYRQMRFIQNRDLGFDRDLLVRISARDRIGSDPESFIAEATRSTAIESVTSSYGAPGAFAAGDGVDLPGRTDRWPLNMMLVDYDFLDVYRMRLIAGRDFDAARGTDNEHAFILNESAVRELGKTPEEVLGQAISWEKWETDGRKEGEVVGVVADFNYESLHRSVSPLVLHMRGENFSYMTLRLAPGRVSEGIESIESLWERMVPDWPFDYTFVDEDLAQDYRAEARISVLTRIFTGLALLIACLGLLALASFTVECRTREIGIRKVLGASLVGVSMLVVREFLMLVAVAVVAGSVVAWFAAGRWLEGFAYRAELDPLVFAVVGLAAVLLAAATVSGQALRAARLDPVETLAR